MKRFFRWMLWILAGLLLMAGIELLRSNVTISVSSYTVVSDKIVNPIRIVFLSDLHGREFGTNNDRLLNKIRNQQPDLIALVGDFICSDADEEEIDAMCSLIKSCTEIAPVYFSLGNQEFSYLQHDALNLCEKIRQAGAELLDNHYLDLTVNGSSLRIGGYVGYYPHPHMMTKDPEQIALERSFFVEFKTTDRFKLLLNHIPTGWLDWGYINRDPVDLVLSGHYHGGLIRIPILEQGLYAPYIGKFPPYTKGIFVGAQATCILSTGLAGSYGLPRFFNPPEICVVELLPAKDPDKKILYPINIS